MAPQRGAHNVNSWGGSIQPPIPSHTIDLNDDIAINLTLKCCHLTWPKYTLWSKPTRRATNIEKILLLFPYYKASMLIQTYSSLHIIWTTYYITSDVTVLICFAIHRIAAVGANRLSVCRDRSFATSVSSTNVPIEPADYGATNSDTSHQENDTT